MKNLLNKVIFFLCMVSIFISSCNRTVNDKEIFTDYVLSERRAMKETEDIFGGTILELSNDSLKREFSKLNKSLKKNYKDIVLEKHNIDEKQLDKILIKGVSNNWEVKN